MLSSRSAENDAHTRPFERLQTHRRGGPPILLLRIRHAATSEHRSRETGAAPGPGRLLHHAGYGSNPHRTARSLRRNRPICCLSFRVTILCCSSVANPIALVELQLSNTSRPRGFSSTLPDPAPLGIGTPVR